MQRSPVLLVQKDTAHGAMGFKGRVMHTLWQFHCPCSLRINSPRCIECSAHHMSATANTPMIQETIRLFMMCKSSPRASLGY
jgi:hypothetical protein